MLQIKIIFIILKGGGMASSNAACGGHVLHRKSEEGATHIIIGLIWS